MVASEVGEGDVAFEVEAVGSTNHLFAHFVDFLAVGGEQFFLVTDVLLDCAYKRTNRR